MAAKPNQPFLVTVVGETASGKSALAMEIARSHQGEIICADSRTIFKGMDIGTAKSSVKEQAEIPHHLLSIIEPGDPFTVVNFKTLAEAAIQDITARGKLPILVGGSGLYIDSVLFDYEFTAAGTTKEREQYAELSIEQLQNRITAKGLQFPANEKNPRHLIRILERGNVEATDRSKIRNHTLVIGLTRSRNFLRNAIEARVEQMFRQGLRREVDDLRQKYDWSSEALTGIGYREFKLYYEEKASMSEVKRQIAQDTLYLAKRQRTWFKRNPSIQWVDSFEEAMAKVDAFLR